MLEMYRQYAGLKRENYILFFGRMVTNLGAMVWPMLTMILNQKLGLSATETAWIIILSGALGLPMNLIGGSMADRFNKKYMIIICDCVSIVLYAVCSVLPLSLGSVWLVIIAALFQSLEWPAYNALVADITPTDKRDKAFSLMYLGANIGLILSPTIAGYLFKHFLWLAFVLNAISIAGSTILIAWGVRDIKPVNEETHFHAYQKAEDHQSAAGIILSSSALMIFLGGFALYEGGYSQFGYLMPLDLTRLHGDDGAALYGTITSVNCILVVLLTPAITKLFELKSGAVKMAFGTVLQAIGFACFLLMLGRIPGYYAAIALFTLGEIFMTTSTGPFLSARVPESHRGRIMGISQFLNALMTGLTQYMSGRLFDAGLHDLAWIISIAMGLSACVAAIILMRVDRKKYPALYEMRS